ncbi:MAG: ATP--cob(I)alamin adenosyltransferase [Pirellulaceae bacterium]|nr:MAG: ATP--cob(I)alamin adenosyltransferase [Pirellulaceae bacterium]
MKIYTKTGDDGTTGLFAGPRVSKDHNRIAAYGDVDELNAMLGWALAVGRSSPPSNTGRPALPVLEWLEQIQADLFSLGAQLATPEPEAHGTCLLSDADIERIEGWIDRMQADLPPLKQFIMPGGNQLGAILHIARTVCRRAERSAVHLFLTEGYTPASPRAIGYLNRLSDFLFVAARWCNHIGGVTETPWPGKKR